MDGSDGSDGVGGGDGGKEGGKEGQSEGQGETLLEGFSEFERLLPVFLRLKSNPVRNF